LKHQVSVIRSKSS